MLRRLYVPAVCLSLFSSEPAHAQRAGTLAGPNQVYVLIDGPPGAILEQQDHDRFVPMCVAPCDRPYSVGRTYRIAGNDVRASEAFVLEGKPGSTVTVHYSQAKHSAGVALTEVGALVTILGGLTLFGGVFGSCSESGGEDACTTYRWLTYTGGALAVVGVTTIVSGIVLMVQGSSASVKQKVAQISPFSARFRIDAESSKPALQAVPTTPILSFSF